MTYFESIFNGIIMIILDVGTWYDLCGLNCQKGKKKKNLQVLETSFSCFGPFGVWGVTVYALNKVAIHALHVIMHYFCILFI